MESEVGLNGAANGAAVSCSSCKACCCRQEAILMGEDDVPAGMIEMDRWGGQVMARLEDGWCVAVDRRTMLCRIYERRPTVCRDFQVGSADCITARGSSGIGS